MPDYNKLINPEDVAYLAVKKAIEQDAPPTSGPSTDIVQPTSSLTSFGKRVLARLGL